MEKLDLQDHRVRLGSADKLALLDQADLRDLQDHLVPVVNAVRMEAQDSQARLAHLVSADRLVLLAQLVNAARLVQLGLVVPTVNQDHQDLVVRTD